eukprot:GAHX01001787.1.p1 GENE.GAHX01001787.1~~GAHX01001787.1.p1  ORF type:complete len:395 (-),score=39.05 GAHX01001787.1:29-1213(-)
MIKDYAPENIFNLDESAFYFRVISGYSYDLKGIARHGQKKSKEIITVLLVTNMTGSYRTPVVFIGNRVKVQKKVEKCNRQDQFQYYYQKNAWMTISLFNDIMYRVNENMKLENRHILMFLDNAPVHSVDLQLSNIRFQFFPKNTTPKLQPLDRDIIYILKRKYKDFLITKYINDYEAEVKSKIDMYEAMVRLESIWHSIDSNTIKNCFRGCGFGDTSNTSFDDDLIDVSNKELVDIMSNGERILLSRESKAKLFELCNEYDNKCFSAIDWTKPENLEKATDHIGKTGKVDDTNLITKLQMYDSALSSYSSRNKSYKSFLDKKDDAVNKNKILGYIQEIMIYINVKIENIDKKFVNILIDLEDLIKSRESKSFKQLKWNEYIHRLKNDSDFPKDN